MNEGEMLRIRVPASTANLGPGFDSIGLALALYLQVDAYPSDNWEVIHRTEELDIFPNDETHFICKIAREVAAEFGKELRPCRLYISSEIPLTRGLGSSASAIVAGIELANAAAELQLTLDDKVRISSKYEGHPDNAGASVCGGMVVGRHNQESTELLTFKLDNINLIAVIPEYELPTEDSRRALPEILSFEQAVQASAVANTFLAAILSGNYLLAGKMMKSDLFHQPYRRELVPHMAKIEKAAAEAGAFGTALSGAGPTIICFSLKEHALNVEQSLKKAFPEYRVENIAVDRDGSMVDTVSLKEWQQS